MLKAIVTIVALLLAMNPLAHAGSQTGTVRFEYGTVFSHAGHPGYTFFFVQGGTRFDRPGCASAYNGERWVINNAWPAAKIQIATLLSAALSGRKVYVQGSGGCEAWGDTETLMDIHLTEE